MKHLGLVWVLLLLGLGAFMGSAMAQLTAGQSVPPSVNVGENAMVTVALTYYGSDATEAIITPWLPAGIETSNPEGQTTYLYPSVTAPISYPIRAVQSGTYIVASQVSYSEDGTWRNLRLESPLTVIGEVMPQPYQVAAPGTGPQLNCSIQGLNASGYYPPGSVPMEMNQSSGWVPASYLPIHPDNSNEVRPDQDHTPDNMYESDKKRNL